MIFICISLIAFRIWQRDQPQNNSLEATEVSCEVDPMLEWIHSEPNPVPLILTAPHSGEAVPPEAQWLKEVPELIRLTDVDRFVDRLYQDQARTLKLPMLVTRAHRYAADLNRFPDDVDESSVKGAKEPEGTHPKGFHWVFTTQGHRLMKHPIEAELHEILVAKYHDTFHKEFAAMVEKIRAKTASRDIYHLDLHSMPSVGTQAHRDPGQKRADVVISDQNGKSAAPPFKDLVLSSFKDQGFSTAYNTPYIGGRITERYGNPARHHHTVQVELNRSLYMNEATKDPTESFDETKQRLGSALQRIYSGIKSI